MNDLRDLKDLTIHDVQLIGNRGHGASRCRANSARIRQSRPDSDLGVEVEVLDTLQGVPSSCRSESHMETLVIYRLGLNQDHCTLALILLIQIVLCSKFH